MTRHPVGDFKRVADDGIFMDFSSIWVDLGDLTRWVLVNGRYPKPGGYKVPDGFDGFDKYQVPKFRHNLGWIL